MLHPLEMRFESAQTSVHAPTRGPTTQPLPPTCKHMRLAARQHPTGARNAPAAAPIAAEDSPEVNLQGLDAKNLDSIDLRDVVRLGRQLGLREATFAAKL